MSEAVTRMAAASSCHETAVDEGASLSTNVADLECNGTLHPHRDFLHIDGPPDAQVLTHTLTLGRRNLPPGAWVLDYDNDGFACCAKEDSDEVLFAEEYLRRQLWLKGDRELLVREPSLGAGMPPNQWSLTEARQKHHATTVTLVVGGNRQPVVFEMTALPWPRCHAHFFWGLASLYTSLGLTTFKGEWSKWAFNSAPRWDRYLQTVMLPEHCVHSSVDARAASLADCWGTCATLATSGGLSSHALVAMSLRWWAGPAKQGRMSTASGQQAASNLLDALLLGMSALAAWNLEVKFDSQWSHRWPRPELPCPHTIELQVTAEATVDLRPWARMAEQGDCAVAKHAWDAVRPQLGSWREVSLKTLMQVCQQRPALQRILAQLLWRLGSRMDFVIMKGRKKGECSDILTVPMDTKEVELTSCSPATQDAYLVKYLYAAVNKSFNQRTFSLATDKATVGGLPIQNTILVYPDNVAVVCPPQAPPSQRQRPQPKSRLVECATPIEKILLYTSFCWCIEGCGFSRDIHVFCPSIAGV